MLHIRLLRANKNLLLTYLLRTKIAEWIIGLDYVRYLELQLRVESYLRTEVTEDQSGRRLLVENLTIFKIAVKFSTRNTASPSFFRGIVDWSRTEFPGSAYLCGLSDAEVITAWEYETGAIDFLRLSPQFRFADYCGSINRSAVREFRGAQRLRTAAFPPRPYQRYSGWNERIRNEMSYRKIQPLTTTRLTVGDSEV